jgi:type VI secretion system protein ImpL
LGPRGEAAQTEAALAALTKNVLDLYYTDFINRYDTILGDIDIIPLESLSHAVEVTNILSGPTSPILNILTAVDKETALTRVDAVVDAEGAAGTVGAVALDEALDSTSIRNRLLFDALRANAEATGGPPPPEPGSFVEERFEWLHTLVARPEGQPSQLDLLMGSLVEVYQELNRLSFGSADATNASGGAALLRFQESASRIPGPLVRWSAQITTSGAGITADGTRAGINAAWQANVLPFCTQATEARYPFDRTSPADVGMADFQKLFGPGGLIDTFYQENLAALVDIRTRPWTWKPVNTADLGISPAVLAQFQAAAEIKEAFFATGPEPKITFQITPYSLDTNANVMTLEIDGQTVEFYQNSGQLLPTAITWPGEVGLARVGIGPPIEGSENVWVKEGPWGLFRLLDGAQSRPLAASDRQRLIFSIGGRLATFDMQSGSVINPFGLGALSSFSCPSSL